jgi:D-amino-acid dehydrogenase
MSGVEIADEEGVYHTVKSDAYVLALGSFSRHIAKTAGIDLHIYPVKGYSVTLPVLEPSRAPQVSCTDDEHKVVFSRFGDRLRIAGTAEFNGYSTTLNRARCEAISTRALEIFPGVSRRDLAQHWTGLRPATPGNVPYVGKSHVRGLYLNTGHGTLGWTHGCGSGRAIADIIDGRIPEVDFSFTGLDQTKARARC